LGYNKHKHDGEYLRNLWNETTYENKNKKLMGYGIAGNNVKFHPFY
jgi:hypothetical protein